MSEATAASPIDWETKVKPFPEPPQGDIDDDPAEQPHSAYAPPAANPKKKRGPLFIIGSCVGGGLLVLGVTMGWAVYQNRSADTGSNRAWGDVPSNNPTQNHSPAQANGAPMQDAVPQPTAQNNAAPMVQQQPASSGLALNAQAVPATATAPSSNGAIAQQDPAIQQGSVNANALSAIPSQKPENDAASAAPAVAPNPPTAQLAAAAPKPVTTAKAPEILQPVAQPAQALKPKVEEDTNKKVARLESEIRKLRGELVGQEGRKKGHYAHTKIVKKTKESPAKPLPEYEPYAVSEGRAWIQDEHGATQIVGIGDKLPSGEVLKSMDPVTGRVKTNLRELVVH